MLNDDAAALDHFERAIRQSSDQHDIVQQARHMRTALRHRSATALLLQHRRVIVIDKYASSINDHTHNVTYRLVEARAVVDVAIAEANKEDVPPLCLLLVNILVCHGCLQL